MDFSPEVFLCDRAVIAPRAETMFRSPITQQSGKARSQKEESVSGKRSAVSGQHRNLCVFAALPPRRLADSALRVIAAIQSVYSVYSVVPTFAKAMADKPVFAFFVASR